MIDQSHKWIFFTATALMCAISFAGTQLKAESADALATALGAPRQLSLPPGFSAYSETKDVRENTSSASIVPNGRSCPAAHVPEILSPSGVAPMPAAARGVGSALGTGSGCLSTRPDVAAAPVAPPQSAVLPAQGSGPQPHPGGG